MTINFDDRAEILDPEELEELETMYFVDLGFCGCGYPNDAATEVYKILLYFDRKLKEDDYKKVMKDIYKTEDIYENPLWLCLAYTMDNAGFTEHGSSVFGSWLEDKGERMLELLEKLKEK